MVSLPVKLYPLQRERRGTELSSFCPSCMGEIGMRKFCLNCGQTFHSQKDPHKAEGLDWNAPLKGERVGDKAVVLTEEELEGARPISSQNIQLDYFAGEIPKEFVLHVRTEYLLGPGSIGSRKEPSEVSIAAWNLLREAMTATHTVAIGKSQVRAGLERPCSVEPFAGGLLLTVLLYDDEVDTEPIAEMQQYARQTNPAHLEMALMVVEQMKRDKVDLSEYADTYHNNLAALVEAKAQGATFEVPKAEAKEPTDLLAQLRASIEAGKPKVLEVVA